MNVLVRFFFLFYIYQINYSNAEECACATGNVHIRSGAGVSHAILGTLPTDSCLAFKGHLTTVSGTHWAHVDYHGQDGWISATYLTFRTCSLSTAHTPSSGTSGCPSIVSRSEWHARPPKHPIGPLPAVPGNVYIHHGATPGCHNKAECIRLVQSYQNYHMDTHGWPDIGYSFIVGEDGNIYEGRGWNEIGAHTYGHNYDGLGFCVMGDFTSHVPNDLAINALKSLIACGVNSGRITQNYVLKGHRDVGQTSCPGDKFYALIQTWPHYHH
ncbi:peptidoglycan recognition protein 1-like [Saccostrea echinata]|uniref:peptidoglycan recognition protein 1-like n=1 Tax=Saccostrea echinata TaxID=191078 RepID=UPI002A81615B|nr:peptidoglycan recognition protein 1-like [Saccostrea echinata]